MKIEKILTTYARILESVGMTISEEGGVYTNMPMEPVHCKVTDRKLFLPFPQYLKDGIFVPDSDSVAFHPMSENVVRGESEVLHFLKNMILSQMTVLTATFGRQLLTLAINVDSHDKLTARQATRLKVIREADARSLKSISNVFKALTFPDGEHRLISMRFSRGRQLDDGRKYARACHVSFPLYAEARDGTGKIYGVNVTKKDRAVLMGLLEVIWGPLVGDDDLYTRGSDSNSAPYFYALMASYRELLNEINELRDIFGDKLPSDLYSDMFPDERFLNDDWTIDLGDMPANAMLIPALPYNTGVGEVAAARGLAAKAPSVATAPRGGMGQSGLPKPAGATPKPEGKSILGLPGVPGQPKERVQGDPSTIVNTKATPSRFSGLPSAPGAKANGSMGGWGSDAPAASPEAEWSVENLVAMQRQSQAASMGMMAIGAGGAQGGFRITVGQNGMATSMGVQHPQGAMGMSGLPGVRPGFMAQPAVPPMAMGGNPYQPVRPPVANGPAAMFVVQR